MNNQPPTITTIDEVIAALDQIISESKQNSSPLGYFAALYRKVTIRVKEGVEEKNPEKQVFQDNERMERLDVIFASRYISAYYGYQNNAPITESWLIAFEMSNDFWPIVLQDLLIGMNAHINLDLGIAAAEVMKGKDLQDLKHDFNAINKILSSLVEEVEEDLSKIWPTLKKLLKWTKKADDFLIDFSMAAARKDAWRFAEQLASLNGEGFENAIANKDVKVAKIAKLITDPGFIASFIFKIIRLGEIGSVEQKIVDLEN